MLQILLLLASFLLVRCQTFQPAAIPLAVRSPYLQAYLAHGVDASTPNAWPEFWTQNHVCLPWTLKFNLPAKYL